MGCRECEALRSELLRERQRSKAAEGSLAVARANSSMHVDHGVGVAIEWVRTMSPRRLVAGGLTIGAEIYKHVAMSVARHLEDRLAHSQQRTVPDVRSEDDHGA